MELTEFRARLQRYVDDGIFCVGVQASVAHKGTVYEIALGSAGPGSTATKHSIWRLFCAAKPVMAVAVALCVQDGLLDLDRAVAEDLPRKELAGADYTPRQLLDHTAGMHAIHGYGFGALPFDIRDEQVTALQPPRAWDRFRRSGYSEYASWHLLGRLVEAVVGKPVCRFLSEEVCVPFAEAEMWFGMTDHEYRVNYSQLAVLYDLRDTHQPVPMLANRLRRPCTDVNVAYGGYGTAHGLRSFYSTLLDIWNGRSNVRLTPEVLHSFVAHRRGRRYDEVLKRDCDFGLGFMVDLIGHGFEPYVSASAFGHTGFSGSAVALADPEADLTVAIVWNGIVGGDIGIYTRRNAALRALYTDLGLTSPPATLGASQG